MKQMKSWMIGIVSAGVAYCSALLPVLPRSCVGPACSACPGGCVTGLGVVWLMVLYILNKWKLRHPENNSQ